MHLTGAQRAAIVFARLEDVRPDTLLTALSENEWVRLLAEVALLPALSPDDVATPMAEFSTAALAYREVRQGGAALARRCPEDRFGVARVAEILSDLVVRFMSNKYERTAGNFEDALRSLGPNASIVLQ